MDSVLSEYVLGRFVGEKWNLSEVMLYDAGNVSSFSSSSRFSSLEVDARVPSLCGALMGGRRGSSWVVVLFVKLRREAVASRVFLPSPCVPFSPSSRPVRLTSLFYFFILQPAISGRLGSLNRIQGSLVQSVFGGLSHAYVRPSLSLPFSTRSRASHLPFLRRPASPFHHCIAQSYTDLLSSVLLFVPRRVSSKNNREPPSPPGSSTPTPSLSSSRGCPNGLTTTSRSRG